VIPSSVTGVLAFLASVGPGYAYVRIRENWRPYVERTALRETAQIVVAGSLATLVAVVVTLYLGESWGFLDVSALAANPGYYLTTHPGKAGVALAVVLAVSYGLAVGIARFGPGRGARVFPDSGWYAGFERRLPRDHGIKATVELRDGRKIAGIIEAFTAEQTPVDDRELTLVRAQHEPMMVWSRDGQESSLDEDFIVLRGSEILYVAASFVPAEPEPVSGRFKRTWAYARLALRELGGL
jgi:hypothetical protein